MAKAAAVHFSCSECGYSTGRWLGRCPGCGSFGTLAEEGCRRKGRAEEAARCSASPTSRSTRQSGSRPASRARPRARRRPRSRVARPRRRRARRREVDAASDGAGRDLARPARAPRDRRGVDGAGEASRARLGGAEQVEILAETNLDAVCATLERERPDVCVIDSDPDALLGGDRLGAGLGRAGARGRGAAAARRQGVRCCALPRRPRHEGRLGRRAARPRAPRRLRPPVRGRPLPRAPRPARREEPLRLDERARSLRDDRRRAAGRPRPVGGLRPERRARWARPSRARSRERGRCCSRSSRLWRRPTSPCPVVSAPASTRNGSR